MVIIYIFFRCFSNVVVGDPVRGQTLIGYLNATAGSLHGTDDSVHGGDPPTRSARREPWIVASHATPAVVAVMLWWILPAAPGLGIGLGFALLLVLLIAFGYAEVFHNAMLPSVTPSDKAGVVSGRAFPSATCPPSCS